MSYLKFEDASGGGLKAPNNEENPPRDQLGQIIISQPTSTGVVPAQTACPPGLEYLMTLDQLVVHQKVEPIEVIFGCEMKNGYTVKNKLGHQVYSAIEESSCINRLCCGNMRIFEMKLLDNFGNEVIRMNRPLAGKSCFCPCWLQKMEVFSPPGCLVGSIQQEWSVVYPKLNVKNSTGDTVMYIQGPFFTCGFFKNVDYKIIATDQTTVIGRIYKQWSGIFQEFFTQADNFGITFPMDLDVNMKATMLGACFLIDYMFFEY